MSIFSEEINKTIRDIMNIKEDGDLCFALLTNSFNSDQGIDTCENIRAVDNEVNFDFVCHMGNYINGNNPRRPSMEVLGSEFDMYKGAIKSGVLHICCGETDGWRDERYIGQLALNIMTDSDWYEATSFVDAYSERQEGKSYYYSDIPQKNTRLIFLNSYFSQHDTEIEFHQKYIGIDANQAKWLTQTALCNTAGKNVLIFSHRIPNSRFETGKDQFVYKGNSTEPILALWQKAKKSGANVVCHFGGAYGIDENISVGGINFAVIGSQLAKDRELGTVNQDLWDAVVVKSKERKLYLFRFGAGEDRIIEF